MKVLCSRTSLQCEGKETRPCDEAFQESDGSWYISVSTLEELRSFILANGACIVYAFPDEEILQLEIYDDYRE